MLNSVKNKKAISNIAKKSFTANKTRNIVAIVAIALTTILFTSVFTVALSFNKSLEQANFRQVGGYAHGGIKDVSYEDISVFENHEKIEKYGVTRALGIISDGAFAKAPTEIKYVSPTYAELSFVDFIEGKLPKEGTKQVAVDTNVLRTLGIDPVLGSEITITYDIDSKKITDTFTLSGYWEANNVLRVNFIYVPQSYVDAIVEENISSSSMFGRIDMDILLYKNTDIDNQILDIIYESGYQTENRQEDNYVDYGVNWGYTSAQVSKNFDLATVFFVIVLLLLFMLSGYLIIFNVFKISIANDIQFYGLLKTIGTTGKQIKRIVYKQASKFCVIGIPLGLVIGFLLGSVLTPFIMRNFNVGATTISANPLIFVFGTVFSIITVVLSCKKPATQASIISPVEAVRFTETKIIHKKNKKSHKVNPFSMAMANITRSKGKTILVVISLSLAILIFHCTLMFTNGFDMQKYLEKYSVADFLVGHVNYLNSNEHDTRKLALSNEELAFFSHLEGVTKSGSVYGRMYNNFAFYDKSVLDDYFAEMEEFASPEHMVFERERAEVRGTNTQGQYLHDITLYGFDDFALENLKLVEGSLENLKNNEIIAIVRTDDYGNVIDGTNRKKLGDSLTVRHVKKMGYFDPIVKEFIEDPENHPNYCYLIPQDYTDVSYTVGAIANLSYNLGYRRSYGGQDVFVLPTSEVLSHSADFYPIHMIMDVEDDNILAVQSMLEQYTTTANPMLDFESTETIAQEFSDFKNMFLLVGTFLSMLIGFIGILNFFNVILTSIQTRKREFAILQSIGMTGKQLQTMLICESLFYIGTTALASFVLALVTNPMLTSVMSNMFWFFTARFTVLPLIIVLVIFIAIGVITPIVLYKTVKRQSIVERIREIA